MAQIYLYANGRFVRDDRADAPARTVGDQLTQLLRMNPSSTAARFEALAGKGQHHPQQGPRLPLKWGTRWRYHKGNRVAKYAPL